VGRASPSRSFRHATGWVQAHPVRTESAYSVQSPCGSVQSPRGSAWSPRIPRGFLTQSARSPCIPCGSARNTWGSVKYCLKGASGAHNLLRIRYDRYARTQGDNTSTAYSLIRQRRAGLWVRKLCLTLVMTWLVYSDYVILIFNFDFRLPVFGCYAEIQHVGVLLCSDPFPSPRMNFEGCLLNILCIIK
jgi:hypothetical protein